MLKPFDKLFCIWPSNSARVSHGLWWCTCEQSCKHSFSRIAELWRQNAPATLIAHITVTVAPRSPLVTLPTVLCPSVAMIFPGRCTLVQGRPSPLSQYCIFLYFHTIYESPISAKFVNVPLFSFNLRFFA